ncbi:hypothetical protein BgAZ_209620 [Babesia gibsoni]|uniref:Replication factor A protein 3 n=1 Tax=Babesia gibsoni TaxID=33632 RepID=A0AAD8USE3_BABGI|nr:hypothetical protein BgAZ_209620 [Babesia gibsoni]
MDDIMMNADHKTSLPKLCNYEMLPAMVGYPVRMVGKVLNIDGINLTLQSTDGAKVNCVLKQPPKHKLSQIVEITGVVTADHMAMGGSVYLEQHGPIHNWDDVVNLEHLNEAIRYTSQQRFARYFNCNTEAVAQAHPPM